MLSAALARVCRAWAVTGSVLLLAACTTTRIEYALPEDYLLADCVSTGNPDPATNGELVTSWAAGRYDLKVCNADKAALRAWKSEYTKGKP